MIPFFSLWNASHVFPCPTDTLGLAIKKDLQVQGILVCSGYYNKNTIDWVAYKEQNFISHTPRGY